MKAVILSLRPQWCEKIFNGEKTIEIRKSCPSIPTPFKVYVYQTKIKFKVKNWQENFQSIVFTPNGGVEEGSGKVIGSFVCDRIDEFDSEWSEYAYACAPTDIPCTMPMSEENAIKICKEKGCMTLEDIIDYFGDEEWRAYFWHITEPKLFDKPRELGEFRKPCNHINDCCTCKEAEFQYDGDELRGLICKREIPLTRPPQSWCYVEEEK